MIIRILGEGQYDVADDRIDDLNALDARLLTAVESGDAEAFVPTLTDLLAAVRELGAPLAEDALVASELVLPSADSNLAEVRALLSDDGLIPG
ncbi:PspA-associated protein PspAA [Amycolatopsis sp. NPDC003865]